MSLPDQEMPENIEFLKDQYQALNQRYDITFPDDPPPAKRDVFLKNLETISSLIREFK